MHTCARRARERVRSVARRSSRTRERPEYSPDGPFRAASKRREGQRCGSVPRDGSIERGTIGPGLTLGTDQGGTPHESGFLTPRAVAGPRCGAPRAVAGPRFHCHASALPNALTQASHSVREEGAHMLAHPTPDHGAARSEYGGDGWSHQGERDSTQAGPRTHIARRAEGTEVLSCRCRRQL